MRKNNAINKVKIAIAEKELIDLQKRVKKTGEAPTNLKVRGFKFYINKKPS